MMGHISRDVLQENIMASTSGTKEIARKLTRAQKRKLLSERGRRGAEKKGIGVGSRVSFDLLAKWKKSSQDYGDRKFMKMDSPSKTKYHSTRKVKDTLVKRNLDFCLHESSPEFSGEENQSSHYEEEEHRFTRKSVEHYLSVSQLRSRSFWNK